MSSLLKSSGFQPIYTGTMEIPVKPVRLPDPIVEIAATGEIVSPEEQYAVAAEECKLMIENAKAEALQILEQARAEVDNLFRDTRQTGYSEGYEEGQNVAMQELAVKHEMMISRVEDMVSEVEADRQNRLRNLSDIMVKMTMESVRMLLARELEMKEPDIQTMVSELIQYVIDSTQIEVRVHPDDFPAAMAAHAKWKGMKFGDWEVAIVPDLQTGRGSCEIRSRVGRVDATMETRMNQLEEAVNRMILQLMAGENNVSG